MRKFSFRLLSYILSFAIILNTLPFMAFAKTDSWSENFNTEFSQNDSKNQWNEIKKNTETVLRNPNMYESIDGLDIDGAEVSHDKNSRTYFMEDGTYLTRFFDDPITYTDEKGNEKDIDNSLKSKGGFYENKENSYTVSLPKKGEEIKIENKGYTFKIMPSFGILDNEVVIDNSIRYNNVSEGVDLQYTANGDSVKEDIILNKPVSNTAFSYVIDCEDLNLEVRDNVLYAFNDDETIFVISAPFMTDNSGEISQNVLLSLDKNNGKNILTVSPDEEWINSPDRAFPICIDPTINLNSSNFDWYLVENGVGTSGYPAGPNVQHIDNPYLYVGFEKGNLTGFPGLTYGQTRSYIKINYDFSSIPDGTIIDAKLRAYKYAGQPSSGTKVYCKMVTSNWRSSRKCWNTQPTESSIISNAVDVSGGNKWVEWDISTAVSEWKNGAANYGLVLTPEYENQDAVCFSGPGNEHGRQAMYFDIFWTVPNAVDENLPLNAPNINLRPLTETNSTGKQSLNGVFADGVVRPTLEVNYKLNDVKYGRYKSADYGRIYPDSDMYKSEINFTLGYKDLHQSNWQSELFTGFSNNVLYNVYATATNGTETTPEGKSDSFIVYQFTEQDTLPYIASFYGVELEQIISDNRPQDYLGFSGNTFFIRNPQKNATIAYTRPDNMSDDQKRALIYANLGRGMHSEFDLEPINVNTGNYYFESVDAISSEYNGTFSFARSYNSIGPKSYGAFGKGWSFAFGEKLSGCTDGNMLYIMGDGKQLLFEKSGKNYLSPAGYNLELEKHTGKELNDTYYTITDADGTVTRFNCYGLMESVTDDKGFSTVVNYDKNYYITGITTASGRQYAIKTNNDGQIVSVTLPNGGVLKYEYENGNLVKYTNADNEAVRYVYNSNGQMTEWYDGNNNRVIRNEYDADGRVIKQTDPLGNTSVVDYLQNKTVVKDAEGNVTYYGYDELYRTTSIEGENNKTAAYNSDNELSAVTENGATIRYEYDDQGNITKQIRQDGSYQEIKYDDSGNAVSVREYDGTVTRNTYDKNGNILSLEKPDGSVITYTYDEYGQVTSLTDGNGNKTKFVYDGLEKMTMTDANNNVSTYYYDAMGNLVNEVDPYGNEVKYIYSKAGKTLGVWKTGDIYEQYLYDSNGNCTAIIDPEGEKSLYTYDQNNQMISAENPLGGVIKYTYDKNGNKISEKDPLGNVTKYKYNEKNQLVETTDAVGRKSATQYDEYGRISCVTDFDGTETTYEYDDILGLPVKITDETGTIFYTYDEMGRTLKESYPDGTSLSISYDCLGNISSVTAKNGLVTYYKYDENSNVISETDSQGKITEYKYDAAGNLIESTDPSGSRIIYAYDKANRMRSQKNQLGGITLYSYDNCGNIAQITYPDNSTVKMLYDKNGNITSLTDQNGNTTHYKYNAVGDLAAQIDALGNVESYDYNAAQNLVSYTDGVSATTYYEYDALGRISETVDPDGYESRISYDSAGNISQVTSANGSETEYEYDTRGNLIKSTTADGLVIEYEYDLLNNIIRQWDNTGNMETNTFDTVGNLLSKTDALGRTAEYSYDLYGNVLYFKDFNGDVTKYSYDLLSRPISQTDPNGQVTKYIYDSLGNLLFSENSSGAVYKYEYNNMSQLVKTVDPLNNETIFEYDNVGNLISQIDAAGNKTQYEYSAVNLLTSQTNANNATQKYEYDAAGQLIKSITAEGNVTEYSYDGRGNVLQEKDPLGYVTEYEYDSLSNLIKIISPRGAKTEYTYNNAGLCISEKDPLGAVTEYEYAPDGTLLSEKLPNSLVNSYEYDKIGRLLSVSDSTGLEMTFEYDEKGNISSQTDQDGNISTYTYDDLNQLVSALDPSGAKTDYQYDNRGNLISVTSPAGGETKYSYDILDRVTSIEQPLTSPLHYEYNKTGQIVSVNQGDKSVKTKYDSVGNKLSVTDALGNICDYKYDKDNNITELTDFAGNSANYEYDAAGNVISETDFSGAIVHYSVDSDYNITSRTDALGNKTEYRYDLAGNLITVRTPSGSETHYSYDSMGNLESRKSADGAKTEYTYDEHNNLTSVVSPDGRVESFIYDVSSKLEKAVKPDGSVIEYDYDSINNLLSKKPSDESDPVTYGYDSVGNRVSMDDESGKTTYEYDILGRVTSVTNSYGYKVSYKYDEYGRTSEIHYPEDRVVSYTYDLGDNLIMVEDSGGETTQYTYDENGNVLTCVRSNGIATEYNYDSMNRVISVENVLGENQLSSFSYEYDDNGQIVTENAKQGENESQKEFVYDVDGQLSEYTEFINGERSVTKYSYSETGNRIAVTKGENENTVIYEYDSSGRLLKETDSCYGVTEYSYDDNGNLIEKNNENSDESVTYSYDIENRLKAVREGGALLMAASYDGDGNRIFQITRQRIPFGVEKSENQNSPENSHAQETENFSDTGRVYDNNTSTNNQKNYSSALDDTSAKNQADVYTYYEKDYEDPSDTIFWYGFGQGVVQLVGNINASLSAYLSDWFCQAWESITGRYDLVLNSNALYSDDDIDAMQAAGLTDEDISQIISADSDSVADFACTPEKQQPNEGSISTEDAQSASQPYDSGVIVIPTNPDETTRIDYDLTYYVNDINTANTQVLMTYGRNDSEKAVYTYGTERLSEDDLQTDTESNYIYDGRGSVVQTVANSEIEMSLTYSAYGEITSGADENFVGYAYNGEESNMVTGLQYLRARYYDSQLGSFITIDSYLGTVTDVISQNRYTYANNDPVNNIDPSGHYSVNTNGTAQYYQSTGLNEMRDFMTAAGLWAGEVEANNAFSRSVAKAQNTSFMNYQSINGISQSTTNAYIVNGVLKAGLTSMNYGCSVPNIPNESVAKFQNNVNTAKTSANAQISAIKSYKKAQYDAYQAYLRWLEEQRRIAEQLAKQQASQYNGMTKSEYANSLRKKYNITSPYSDDYIIKNFGDPNWNKNKNSFQNNGHYNSYSNSNLKITFDFNPSFSDYLGWGNDAREIAIRGYNLYNYGFNVNRVGNYATISGARSNVAINYEIYGTRYALKNADAYTQVFEYIDWKTATKGAFNPKTFAGKANYALIAIDVGLGIYENIQNDTRTQKIVSDAIVDAGFGAASIWASTAAGAALGSVVPGAGNVVGAIGGLVVGFGIYLATDAIEINDKTIIDWTKEGAGWVADEIVNGIDYIASWF